MSEIDGGGPAFPLPVNADIDCAGRFASGYGGISKREWFAGMALQGILQLLGSVAVDFGGPERTAKMSYDVADAMIRAEKGEK
jgi:hypothetical protein